MSLRKILILICSATVAVSLALGYVSVGWWQALGAALVTSLAWLLAYRRTPLCPPSAALAASIGCAALGVVGATNVALGRTEGSPVGLLTGATPFLMLLSATFALASWDLVLLDQALAGSSGSSAQAVTLLEKRHYSNLALALGLGLVITVAGRMIHLQIPFVGMIVLMILALLGLDRVLRTLIS